MQIRVSPTDAEWFRFLRDRPHLDEANFWIPSGARLSPRPGERIVFKSKVEAGNRLIGGAFVSGFTHMTVSEAWSFFGESNGVATREHLLRKINAWRTGNRHPAEPDPTIGCLLLFDTFFAADSAQLPPPAGFPSEAVRGKNFGPDSPGYAEVDGAFVDLFWRSGVSILRDDADLASRIAGPTRGDPRLVVPRVGQQAFKGLVLTSYQRRCAITGSRIEPVLQAAHIHPVASGGEHRVDNGLLLRSDVHKMFDDGYLGLDDRRRLQVSRRLRLDYGNGVEFYARAGEPIAMPVRRADQPNVEATRWHMDEVFLR